jgi:hypothetical protein
MKGRCVLVIPGCLHERDAPIGMKRASKKQNQAVKTKKHGGRAVNRQIRPLALSLDQEVGSALLESGLQTPAFHKRLHDLFGGLRLVCGKQRGWRGRFP